MKKIQLKNGLQLSKQRLSRLQEAQMTDLKGGKKALISTVISTEGVKQRGNKARACCC